MRDVLAVKLPFFMSADDVIGRAKEAVIYGLDKNGILVSQVHGSVTTARMMSRVSLQLNCFEWKTRIFGTFSSESKRRL